MAKVFAIKAIALMGPLPAIRKAIQRNFCSNAVWYLVTHSHAAATNLRPMTDEYGTQRPACALYLLHFCV